MSKSIDARIQIMRSLCHDQNASSKYFEAATVGLTVMHDTVGGNHPVAAALDDALKTAAWEKAVAAAKTVITLAEQGALASPRLQIAHEIEGSLLDIADSQVAAAERNTAEPNLKQTQLAIAAFLAGAALEDALRRLCDARGITYDAQRSTISKLQAALYQPSKGVEVINGSENKQITAWGDTRNKADHGKFNEITYAETLTMALHVRAFIDKHLP
jgi:hypothetical protein